MIQKGCGLPMMLEKLEDGICQKPTCGHSDSLAKTFQLQENKKELNEERDPDSSMRLCVSLTKRKKIDPNGLSVRTLKICYLLTKDEDSSPFSLKWGGRGYTVEWRVYNSKDYGVPQNRERVYIVGHYGEPTGQPLLPIRRESTATLRQIVGGSQGERVYDGNKISCTLSSQGGGCGAKTGLYTFVDINKKGNVQTTDTARALLARYNKGQPNRPAECSGVIEAAPAIQSLGNATPYKNDYTVLATGISRTLMACSYKHVPQVAFNDNRVKVMPILTPDRLEKRQNGRRIKNEGEPAFTLTGQDRHGVLIADEYIKIRKLTPRECFRLQGFTDEQFDKAAAVNSETQLYKQAGNAVTVNVVEEIGRHIKDGVSRLN